MNKKYKDPISITHPHLLKEWDYAKNGDLLPENVTAGSRKKVWLKCSKEGCGYGWVADISNRSSGHGCPACSGRVASSKNSLAIKAPHLLKEWDYSKNGDLIPENVTYKSHKKVWWRCSKDGCGYGWLAIISNRFAGNGCPACAGQVVTDKNNLAVKAPHLLKEWDYAKNGDLLPENVAHKSDKKVWWKCSKDSCGYEWTATISSRSNGRGCPACAGKVVTNKNNLAVMNPELAKEWDYAKNGNLRPEDVTTGSDKKVWWKCLYKDCVYEWEASVCKRSMGSSCPKCSGGSISKISQKWLDSLGISIENRETVLQDLRIRVDGFNPYTSTVYEFLGDYWHGNPKIYSAGKINPTNKKTFGSLYKETFDRFDKIKKAGYNVVHIWESDYKNT